MRITQQNPPSTTNRAAWDVSLVARHPVQPYSRQRAKCSTRSDDVIFLMPPSPIPHRTEGPLLVSLNQQVVMNWSPQVVNPHACMHVIMHTIYYVMKNSHVQLQCVANRKNHVHSFTRTYSGLIAPTFYLTLLSFVWPNYSCWADKQPCIVRYFLHQWFYFLFSSARNLFLYHFIFCYSFIWHWSQHG